MSSLSPHAGRRICTFFNGSRGGHIRYRDHGVGHSAVECWCQSIDYTINTNSRGRGTTDLSQRFQTLLLGVGVDIGPNHKAHDVEERHPGVLGKELLRKGKGQRRSDPANLHDGHEASAHGSADLVDGARPGDNGHGGEVDGVLDGGDLNGLHISICCNPPGSNRKQKQGIWSAYEKVANEDLQDLGLQTRAAGKDLLQDADEEMAQRRGDEHAVQRHLGHTMAEIVAVLANIVGDPGREEFLQGREDT